MQKWLEKLGIDSKETFAATVRQFFKFGMVGASSTVISLAIYYLAVLMNKDWYLAGNIVGYIVSVAYSYFMNKSYVFQKQEGGAKPLLRFLAVYGTTFVLGNLLLWVQVDLLGISEMLAPIIGLAVTVPINYLLSKFWAFK